MTKLFLAIICSLAINQAFCQEDTLQNVNEPAGQEEKYWRQLPHDIGPEKDSVELSVKELPEKIITSLKEGEQYKGWENARIFLDKNTKLYKLHITNGKRKRIIGLNENGKPVTFSEITLP